MSITLLLDLDDTLLDTNVDVFLPAYYAALSEDLCDVVPPEAMLAALRLGVRQMMLSHDPARTLQQVFEAEFYPSLGLQADALRDRLANFYGNVYPNLRGNTRQRDGVRELMQWASAAGHLVALATDPLFPMAATIERVRWAGLDASQFEIISSFETFHFTKTHPAYFAEMLGRLGWPERPAVMAGNDVERDLVPAARLGLTTFHVSPNGISEGDRSGNLIQLREWIEAHESSLQPTVLKDREAVLAVLEATPAALQGMTTGLTASGWAHEPAADEWAVIELVCHLRDTEREVHSQQISTLIDLKEPFVARPDAAVWAKQRRYLGENGAEALREFAAAREATLERLRSLPDETWSKGARHAIFGPSNFLEVIGFMAEHDRQHVRQAWRTLRAQNGPSHPN